MLDKNFEVTMFTKNVTDSGKDEPRKKKREDCQHKFRLLDDDGLVYIYGFSCTNDDEDAFNPLDYYGPLYGVTEIQYRNSETGEYETL